MTFKEFFALWQAGKILADTVYISQADWDHMLTSAPIVEGAPGFFPLSGLKVARSDYVQRGYVAFSRGPSLGN